MEQFTQRGCFSKRRRNLAQTQQLESVYHSGQLIDGFRKGIWKAWLDTTAE
jgi:hypothetical protein